MRAREEIESSHERGVVAWSAVRRALKQRTGARQVDSKAIECVVEMLNEELERILAQVESAYAKDKEVREFHGYRRPSPLLGVQHLPATRTSQAAHPPGPDV